MGTESHTKKTWLLYTPKAPPEAVLRRYDLESFTSYSSGNRVHLELTYPRLRVLSLLYATFIDAMDQGKRSEKDRDIHLSELDSTRTMVARMCTLNLVCHTEHSRYAITEYGADEYEFQWYVADKMRQVGPIKKFAHEHKVNQTSRLTSANVKFIRESSASIEELADLFETSSSTIWRVKNYHTYKDLP